ncbi:MAG: hypothetical protein COV44_03770 [Deltaproteobacteria bacterium CG11_big_fil_rev_8_21_14_0_20_45_16]|nr:MAG: hypothetical protein COV44_03770 [Deltaproteobacteria bacterium CG11_big_fil_rev_8_21_14_0_20_45_16]
MNPHIQDNQIIWIVVAHRSEARIYESQLYDKSLTSVESLQNSMGRLKNTEFDSDGPGHTKDRFGPGKHAMEPKHDSVSQNQWNFAKEIAQTIDAGRVDHKYDRLILVAGSELLGDIRKNLTDHSMRLILASHPKNLFGAENQDQSKFEAALKELVAL